MAWGGLGKPDRGLGRGETFFPDSGSDRGSDPDSDETFQISRNLASVANTTSSFVSSIHSLGINSPLVARSYVDVPNSY